MARRMLRIFSTCLATFLLVVAAGASAEETAEFVQVTCVPELDMVEIRPVTVNSAKAAAAADRWPEALKRRHGLYALRPLLIMRDGKVQGLRARRVDCRLSRGRVRMDIAPLPDSFDLSAPCGASLSIELSMVEGNRMLVDRLPFQRRCDLPHRVTRLVYLPGQAVIHVDGVFLAPTGETTSTSVLHSNPAEGPSRMSFFTDHSGFRVLQRASLGF
jgi:hypothetical protein